MVITLHLSTPYLFYGCKSFLQSYNKTSELHRFFLLFISLGYCFFDVYGYFNFVKSHVTITHESAILTNFVVARGYNVPDYSMTEKIGIVLVYTSRQNNINKIHSFHQWGRANSN